MTYRFAGSTPLGCVDFWIYISKNPCCSCLIGIFCKHRFEYLIAQWIQYIIFFSSFPGRNLF